MSSFGAFVAVFGVVVGLLAASLSAYGTYRERAFRKRRLEALEEGERSRDGDRILAVLDELSVRDYVRSAEARDAVDRNFWRLVASVEEEGRGGENGDEPDGSITVAGTRVPAGEIEEALKTDPAVADAAVVGVPDEHYGEVPHAYVVLREEIDESDKLTWEVRLLDHAREVLPRNHVPNGVTFVDGVPRTTTGEVMRRALEDHSETHQEGL